MIAPVELRALKVGILKIISEELVDSSVEIWRDALENQIRIAIHGYVWAESEHVRYQEIKYPRDWWQAFKERWFPKWLLTKYPVDYYVTMISVDAIYPEFKQKLPDFKSRLVINREDWITSIDGGSKL